MPNLLANETSPYLLQHKDNPVHWVPWTAEALADAKAQNKPILLSVGYAACHWCHVMAHECFEDETIAAQMNRDFICIKVDREERPDLDQIYQNALAVMGGQGGWPLTMFLDIEGQPFFGGTYWPPTDQHGRPGFPTVMQHITQMWQADPTTLNQNRRQIAEALSKLNQTDAADGQTLSPAHLTPIAKQLIRQIDPFDGGFGNAPKFPNIGGLDVLWRGFLRTGLKPFHRAVSQSLTQMSEGGIYDHFGGGFARYSVDEKWLVPHFEKMLYDNAQLLDLLALIYPATQNALFKQRATEIADFVIRDLTLKGGAFAATLDADTSEGEGAYYSWTPDEIFAALPHEYAQMICAQYDITQDGNFEGRAIPNRLHRQDAFSEEEEAVLKPLREQLYAERLKRPKPARDDKVLADWNGQMITALAHAAQVFDRADYLAAAQQAFAFIIDTMTKPDGRIIHSWAADILGRAETLDDLAHMARAALALHRATQNDTYLAHAEQFVSAADAHFYDAADGAYFMTPQDGEALIMRPRSIFDNAVPNANATLLEVLAHLATLTGKGDYASRAVMLARAFSSQALRNGLGAATFINAYETLATPISITVMGKADDDDTKQMVAAITQSGLPAYTFQQCESADTLPDNHPAKDKVMVDGKATTYICIGQTCSLPITDISTLTEKLRPEQIWPRSA
ncbi:MAG: thioredoxin domain-containing protein [Alphaproteobacteria bacterium]